MHNFITTRTQQKRRSISPDILVLLKKSSLVFAPRMSFVSTQNKYKVLQEHKWKKHEKIHKYQDKAEHDKTIHTFVSLSVTWDVKCHHQVEPENHQCDNRHDPFDNTIHTHEATSICAEFICFFHDRP